MPPRQRSPPLKFLKKGTTSYGSGAHGQVFIGYEQENDDEGFQYCGMIKESTSMDRLEKSFAREVALLSSIAHENIVRCFGSDIRNNKLYLYYELSPCTLLDIFESWCRPNSMKYINRPEYSTLQDGYVMISPQDQFSYGLMPRHVACDITLVMRAFMDIFSGLEFLHQSNGVHRDIKPANIMLSYGNVFKLADFGLSRLFNGDGQMSGGKGTHYYSAPEMGLGKEKYAPDKCSNKIDIYSAGVSIYDGLVFATATTENKMDYAEHRSLAFSWNTFSHLLPKEDTEINVRLLKFCRSLINPDPANRPDAATCFRAVSEFHQIFEKREAPSNSQYNLRRTTSRYHFAAPPATNPAYRNSSVISMDTAPDIMEIPIATLLSDEAEVGADIKLPDGSQSTIVSMKYSFSQKILKVVAANGKRYDIIG